MDAESGNASEPGWSAPSRYASRTWQTEDGLPNNRVQSLAQTADGYLWVGTRDGLARFDGATFTVYRITNTPALRGNYITALCATRDGSLCIGTEVGLVILKNGIFSRIDTSNGLAGNFVTSLCQSKNGPLWIGTTTGLSRQENGAFVNYTTNQGLLSSVVRSVFEDQSGAVWVATPRGLNRLQNGRFEQYTADNGYPQDSVRSVCEEAGGDIWISSDHGLVRYDGRRFEPFTLQESYTRTYIPAVCADSQGNVWAGTYNGLRRLREGKFEVEVNNNGTPYDQINTMLEDREGNLWAGSREGLIRLTRQRVFVYDVNNGLSLNNVISVLQDRTDGALWAGTWGGGLNRIPGGRVHVYDKTNAAAEALILSLCQSADGSLWIGFDFDGGVTQFKDGKFRRFLVNDGLPSSAARVLCMDRSNQLWIGTGRGLYALANGKIVNYSNRNPFLGTLVHAICEDAEGAVWIGSSAGLGRLKNGKVTVFSPKPGVPRGAVTALASDTDGNLWIGTLHSGLYRYRSGKFTSFLKEQGLPANEIFELLDDGAGSLWITTDDGIFRVAKHDLELLSQNRYRRILPIAYRRSDGLESTTGSNAGKPAAWKASDGRLLFATTKGLAVIDPKLTQVNKVVPSVYIEEVKADYTTVWSRQGSFSGRTLRIPPGRGEVEFSFAALSYTDPEKCRFRYQLDGVDRRLTIADAKRTAKYINLKPGEYKFHVIACNSDGVWNETGDTILLYLTPHYWQTDWFQALCVATILATVAGASRQFTQRRMQRKLELLERQHALERERGRIAKDIHDDLGSSLTRIMLLGTRAEQDLAENKEITPHLQKIIASCGATIQAMDEIVWAVNPENDTLEGLVAYLSQYAERFFEDTPIRCRFELPIQSSAFALPAEVRHDLFLAIKEALNNVLKHSGASEVSVQVTAEGDVARIVIEDNGRGFDSNHSANGRVGNGLKNIQRRVDEHGGRLEVSTTPGKGTRLALIITVKQNPAPPPPHIHRDDTASSKG